VVFPKLDAILNYFNISPLNNRKVMNFFKSAVHQAIEMRDEGDKVFCIFKSLYMYEITSVPYIFHPRFETEYDNKKISLLS
jgi:hypothetical protein